MPYVYEDKVQGSAAFLERTQTPLRLVLEEQFALAMEESPIRAAMRWRELVRLRGEGQQLSREEAMTRIEKRGLRGRLEISQAENDDEIY